ncbi:MAG: hypothetical protein IJF08_01065 [Clostridia bacterium]|nr:hypothetical protein [Clostridia bacterium]
MPQISIPFAIPHISTTHISTYIILGVGALLVLLFVFCLFVLIISSASAASTKKKLVKIAPDSDLLKTKQTRRNEKKAAQAAAKADKNIGSTAK